MCLGMAAIPFFLSIVFLQSDCGVPLVTITSSPAGSTAAWTSRPASASGPALPSLSQGLGSFHPCSESSRLGGGLLASIFLLDENGWTVRLGGPSAILRITHSFFSFLSDLDLGF